MLRIRIDLCFCNKRLILVQVRRILDPMYGDAIFIISFSGLCFFIELLKLKRFLDLLFGLVVQFQTLGMIDALEF